MHVQSEVIIGQHFHIRTSHVLNFEQPEVDPGVGVEAWAPPPFFV